MAGNTNNALAKQTPAAYLNKWNGRFANNDTFNISEADLREMVKDISENVAFWSKLTVLTVRGSALPLQTKSDLATLSEEILVVNQLAMVANNTDAYSASQGADAGYAEYRIIKDSHGPVQAFVDAKPETTARVKVRWVQTGDVSNLDNFPLWVEDDHPYAKGDPMQYTFEGGQARLLQARRTLPLPGDGTFNPVPTGEEDDPNYIIFAPLQGATGGEVTKPMFDAEVAARIAGDLTTGQKALIDALTAPITQYATDGTITGETDISAAAAWVETDRSISLNRAQFVPTQDVLFDNGTVRGNGAVIEDSTPGRMVRVQEATLRDLDIKVDILCFRGNSLWSGARYCPPALQFMQDSVVVLRDVAAANVVSIMALPDSDLAASKIILQGGTTWPVPAPALPAGVVLDDQRGGGPAGPQPVYLIAPFAAGATTPCVLDIVFPDQPGSYSVYSSNNVSNVSYVKNYVPITDQELFFDLSDELTIMATTPSGQKGTVILRKQA